MKFVISVAGCRFLAWLHQVVGSDDSRTRGQQEEIIVLHPIFESVVILFQANLQSTILALKWPMCADVLFKHITNLSGKC